MKYINIETKEIMDRDEAFDWILEKCGLILVNTVDVDIIRNQIEALEILLEAYFYQDKEKETQTCKWCEELDETYQRHKEDYLFD